MQVEIDLLKPGSLIQSDIKDSTGKVVVKAGTKTTPLLLKRLVTWGVKQVDIENQEIAPVITEDTSDAKTSEKKMNINFDKELIKEITKRFSNVRDDEFMEKIMRLAIKHLSNRPIKKEVGK